MANQEFTLTMHTLNKYGVPCTDVTDYVTRSSGIGISSAFYMQKSPTSVLMFSKMKSSKYTRPDPFEPITGIEGFDYCVFVNDNEEFGSTGYIKYYSLGSGALKATVALPCMIGDGLIQSVDINSSYVVYDGVESELEPPKYNRFIRQGDGSLVIDGRLLFERGMYYPNSYLYAGTTGTHNSIQVSYSDISVESDEFLVEHEIPEGTLALLQCSGTPPSPLVNGNAYYLIEVTAQSFKVASTPGGTAIDLTSQGTGYCTFSFSGYTGYHNALYLYDKVGLRASNIINDEIYINVFGEEKQIGRFFKEPLPDLSADSDTKRMCSGYLDLFVGDLDPTSDYVLQVPFSSIMPEDAPNKEQYTFLVNIFNDQVDDGSGEYTIGSGQIQGVWCDKNFKILLSFDDVRGSSGNQAYQKWYSYDGQFLFVWKYPEYTFEETTYFYGLAGRVFHGNYMFDVMINEQTNTSYLYSYYMGVNSTPSIHELDNPYKDDEGYYFVTNLQIIGDQYLMLNLNDNNSHCVFFKVYSPQLGIVGEVTMAWAYAQQQGYRVVPKIGVDEPISPYNPVLLQLCNYIRSLKMTWASNQVQVCQDHANWCVAHSVAQHEGPVPGEDAETSLRNRNNAKGIYGGVSENITLVIEAEDETEQTNAFDAWYNSERHLENIVRGGNKNMSYAWAQYPSSVTQITVGPGFTSGDGSYTTEETIFEIPEHLRGKYKIYVQNFIWY